MPALIVGDRSITALQSERDVPPLVRQGSEPCAVSVPASPEKDVGNELGPASKAARKRPDERPDRGGIMPAHALLAAVRGVFDAGVSRG